MRNCIKSGSKGLCTNDKQGKIGEADGRYPLAVIDILLFRSAYILKIVIPGITTTEEIEKLTSENSAVVIMKLSRCTDEIHRCIRLQFVIYIMYGREESGISFGNDTDLLSLLPEGGALHIDLVVGAQGFFALFAHGEWKAVHRVFRNVELQ